MRPSVCGWGVSGNALRSIRHIYFSLRARYRWQFCLNTTKLYMSYFDDSRRNLIDFGSRGQRSRSTSAQDARAYSTLWSSCLNYLLISIASFQYFPVNSYLRWYMRSIYVYDQNQIAAKLWLVFRRMHVVPTKAKHGIRTDKQTDDGQRDPYVARCFVGSPVVWDRQTHWLILSEFLGFFRGGDLQPPSHFWIEWWKISNERLHPPPFKHF